ncbi:M14 family zinc carboxypeptidase [Luteipulveratus mongoliensis]|uniref:Peptidase M14 domain-containing protein n=1 Tax=Luteipulveratus mongoliensis TaxID=571913 RepID=A0A0K1JRB1_9MICO|nr:M14 family zinc carboxypeptidase [Luteipulveratus mongoliensis]AKU19259.1 hypothetical protein VV02_23830 [Luteipulveratus mongoliensis]
MTRRRLLAPTLAACALVASAATAAAAQPTDSTPGPPAAGPTDSRTPSYYDVTLDATHTSAGLIAQGADVSEGSRPGQAVVVATPEQAGRLRTAGYRLTYTASLYAQQPQARTSLADGTYYGGYHTVAAHEQHVADVAAAHPDLATATTVGQSWLKQQGRGGHDIKAICITKKAEGDCDGKSDGKPKFTMMAQIHARELATGELAWKWIDTLVGDYGKDDAITKLMDTTELWVIPIANPDGVDVVASNPDEPLWQRKNVNDVDTADCSKEDQGIDLNRNADVSWNNPDQGGPCDETFSGKAAASEPELQGLQGFFSTLYADKRANDWTSPADPDTTGTFITLHSYGNYVIYPWGHTNDASPDKAKLKAIGDKYAASNGYQVGTAGETVGYLAPGGTEDWLYYDRGVPGVTFEVGGDGGDCGGFFPAYSCMDDFWAKNKPAFITAGQLAAKPYAVG